MKRIYDLNRQPADHRALQGQGSQRPELFRIGYLLSGRVQRETLHRPLFHRSRGFAPRGRRRHRLRSRQNIFSGRERAGPNHLRRRISLSRHRRVRASQGPALPESARRKAGACALSHLPQASSRRRRAFHRRRGGSRKNGGSEGRNQRGPAPHAPRSLFGPGKFRHVLGRGNCQPVQADHRFGCAC